MKVYWTPKLWPAVLVVLATLFACANAGAQIRSESTLVNRLRQMYSDEDGELWYFIKWFDLNGDSIPEAIVHMIGPNVCGTSGCDTHVFARRGGDYRLISTIGLSNPLVIASQRRSHGWRNLIVFVVGGGIQPGYYAELQFNGKTYPENPTVKPAKRIKGKPQGAVLIKDYGKYTEGKQLIPKGNLTNGLTGARKASSYDSINTLCAPGQPRR